MDIPPDFDAAFLDWFRVTTETYWASYQTKAFEQYVARGTGGWDWQTGTRWVGGMSEAELNAAEARWLVRFPPDFRLFLSTLHTVDRPMVGAHFSEDNHLVPVERPSFYDWRPGLDGPPVSFEGLNGAFDWLCEGINFDIEHGLWLPSWGTRPATAEGCRQRLRELLAQAPKLLPLYEHRFLLAEPCRSGNPVFSIWQTDIIVYGLDLREYFLWEFAYLLFPTHADRVQHIGERWLTRWSPVHTGEPIPFWDELRAWRYRSQP